MLLFDVNKRGLTIFPSQKKALASLHPDRSYNSASNMALLKLVIKVLIEPNFEEFLLWPINAQMYGLSLILPPTSTAKNKTEQLNHISPRHAIRPFLYM